MEQIYPKQIYPKQIYKDPDIVKELYGRKISTQKNMEPGISMPYTKTKPLVPTSPE